MNAVNLVVQHTYDFEHNVWSRARHRNVGLVAMKVLGGAAREQGGFKMDQSGPPTWSSCFERRVPASHKRSAVLDSSHSGMVQMQVTPQGCLGSTPEGRRPQVRGFRTGGSLAFARSTPATKLLPPSSMLKLNHAQMAARFKTSAFSRV
ncbi:MAG: hypothetical protein ACLQVF_39275 [Isosphaeraceae bacterium]